MSVRNRLDPDGIPLAVTQLPDDAAGDSDALRAEGAAFLAAADAAIARALSRDSRQFLQQNRQQGGE